MSAASLYKDLALTDKSEYYDRRSGLSEEDYTQRLSTSTTLYVGNLSHYTQEAQLRELFSTCGTVKNLHMGLDRVTFKPCGFCFVEYQTREEARIAIDALNLVTIDEQKIRLDWDLGFSPDRRFGRGSRGGQVRADRQMGDKQPYGNNRDFRNNGGNSRKRPRNSGDQDDTKRMSSHNNRDDERPDGGYKRRRVQDELDDEQRENAKE